MSNLSESFPASGAAIASELLPILFPENQDESPVNTYAVLDGAAIPNLLDHLYGDEPPEFVCLYAGELEPDLAECAPYLIELKPEAPFTTWLVTEGWGNHWGIFVQSTTGLKGIRTHFRKFLMVKDPEENQIYLRFYDPRVLAVFLETCNEEELEAIFGPLNCYLCEGDSPAILLKLTRLDDQLTVTKVPLPGNSPKR